MARKHRVAIGQFCQHPARFSLAFGIHPGRSAGRSVGMSRRMCCGKIDWSGEAEEWQG